MCSIISLSGAACCRRRNDFYGLKRQKFAFPPQVWLFTFVSVTLIQTITHNGDSTENLGPIKWILYWITLSPSFLVLTFLETFFETAFLFCPVLHLKLHSVCGFKPSHAPLTIRHPAECSGSHSQVLGCIFHGIFLLMLLIYDGVPGSKETSHSDLAAKSPFLPLAPPPRPPLTHSASPGNVTQYMALCPLFIVGHHRDTVTFM